MIRISLILWPFSVSETTIPIFESWPRELGTPKRILCARGIMGSILPFNLWHLDMRIKQLSGLFSWIWFLNLIDCLELCERKWYPHEQVRRSIQMENWSSVMNLIHPKLECFMMQRWVRSLGFSCHCGISACLYKDFQL